MCIRDRDIDNAFVCVEDPNLLNTVQYGAPKNELNYIRNSYEFEKVQMKVANDFYHYIPKSLEEHALSLKKVLDLMDWLGADETVG